MEEQCGPLSWDYYYQEEEIGELKCALLYNTWELEKTILSAHEEIARKEGELAHLNDLLATTLRERNEAQAKCQTLMLEKLNLLQQLEGGTHEEHTTNKFPHKDHCDIEEQPKITIPMADDQALQQPPQERQGIDELEPPRKALPEKGKLLKAVMEAGPLLQTLLVAGPLPQWQHPPPQLNSIEIPPVKPIELSNGCCLGKKRDFLGFDASDDFSPNKKYQKIVQQLIT